MWAGCVMVCRGDVGGVCDGVSGGRTWAGCVTVCWGGGHERGV